MNTKNDRYKKPQDQVNMENLAPVYSIEAEESLIGAILTDPDDIMEKALEKLSPEDFFSPSHQEIFRLLIEMYHKGKMIDVMTLTQQLKDRNLLESVGGVGNLSQLCVSTFTLTGATSYIHTIREKAIMRRLQQACGRIVYDIQNRQHEAEQVLDEAIHAISFIGEAGYNEEVKSKPQLSEAWLKNYDLIQTSQIMPGVETGFKTLDNKTGGLHEGDLFVLAARPSVGKTAFAINVGTKIAERGNGVLFISTEMSDVSLLTRQIACKSGVLLRDLTYLNSKPDLDAKVKATVAELEKMPFYISYGAFNLSKLLATSKKYIRKQKVKVIIVDYLTNIAISRGAKDLAHEYGEMTKALKNLAMATKTSVILLCQIDRKAENEADNEPRMHHLKRSGDIEQAADVIMMMWNAKDDILKSKIEKQRNGPVGQLKLEFSKEICLFHEQKAEEKEEKPKAKKPYREDSDE